MGPESGRGQADFGRQAYLDVLAARDPRIRQLQAEGFEFVTNAFRPGMKPAGIRARDAEQVAADLRRRGFEVELSDGYDERGNPRPALSGIWRRKAAGASPVRPRTPRRPPSPRP